MNPSNLPVNSRKELLNKLHNKINIKHNERFITSQQKINKMNKDIKKEKKQNDQDPRVTQLMKNYFINAMQKYPTYNVLDPHTILENEEEYKLQFLNFCIKLLKKNNNNLDILQNPYCNYMREVFHMN